MGPEQRQRAEDATTGLERYRSFFAPADAHPEVVPVTECLAQLPAEPGEVDDDLADAGAHECREMPGDERTSAHLQQRLRYRIGERTHALAAARREQHRLHGPAPVRARCSAAMRSLACGNCAVTRSSRNRASAPSSA